MATGLWLQLAHAQTSTTVTLSDGTGAIGSANFHVTSADLGTAAPIIGGLSGRGSYAPVVCSVKGKIIGATAEACYGLVENLNKLFSLAAIWASGVEGVDPVLVRFSPPGSTTTGITSTTDLTAVVLRPIGGGVNVALTKPVRSSAAAGYEIGDLDLRFERQGEWCYYFNAASAVERIAGTSAATNTTVQLLSLTAGPTQHIKAPAGVALSTGASVNSFNGIIAMSSNANSIQIANITYTGGNFATVADGRLPRSGSNAIRFTPTDTTVNTTNSVMSVSSVDRPVFVVSVRNNSAGGHQYRIRLRIDVSGLPVKYTTWRVIDDANTNCRHVVFPAIGLVYGTVHSVRIEVAASATGSMLDFNYIAHYDSAEYTTQAFRFGSAFGKMVIRNPLMTNGRGIQAFEGSYTNDYDVTSRTANARALPLYSAAPPWMSSDGVYVLAMVHSGGYWAQRTGANALDTIQYVAMRRRISITPR